MGPQTHSHAQRQTDTQTNAHKDRHTQTAHKGWPKDRQTHTQTHAHTAWPLTYIHTYRQTHTQTHAHTDWPLTYIQTDRQSNTRTHRQTDTQADRKSERQTDTQKEIKTERDKKLLLVNVEPSLMNIGITPLFPRRTKFANHSIFQGGDIKNSYNGATTISKATFSIKTLSITIKTKNLAWYSA